MVTDIQVLNRFNESFTRDEMLHFLSDIRSKQSIEASTLLMRDIFATPQFNLQPEDMIKLGRILYQGIHNNIDSFSHPDAFIECKLLIQTVVDHYQSEFDLSVTYQKQSYLNYVADYFSKVLNSNPSIHSRDELTDHQAIELFDELLYEGEELFVFYKNFELYIRRAFRKKSLAFTCSSMFEINTITSSDLSIFRDHISDMLRIEIPLKDGYPVSDFSEEATYEIKLPQFEEEMNRHDFFGDDVPDSKSFTLYTDEKKR